MIPSIRLSAVCLILGGLGGCAKTEPPSPRLAYCTQLYHLYFRYHPIITYAHDGQRARAELALHACERGDYAAGIESLTALLTRDRLTVPPPPSGSGV